MRKDTNTNHSNWSIKLINQMSKVYAICLRIIKFRTPEKLANYSYMLQSTYLFKAITTHKLLHLSTKVTQS